MNVSRDIGDSSNDPGVVTLPTHYDLEPPKFFAMCFLMLRDLKLTLSVADCRVEVASSLKPGAPFATTSAKREIPYIVMY